MSESDRRMFEAACAESRELMERLPVIQKQLSDAANLCSNALRRGGKLLFCGNGGSAAECQHLATEFVVRLTSDRDRGALPALALTTDTSLLTACSNDFGFDLVFARQVDALMKEGDVLFLLSTSGKSANLIEAARSARARQGRTIGLLGRATSELDPLLDLAVHIPSPSPQHVQEAHLFCGHLLVEMIENRWTGSETSA
ncbi:MAG: SIS domain-containing protein [bacterium]|nr:SIS domain-containing protein [bacterium]